MFGHNGLFVVQLILFCCFEHISFLWRDSHVVFISHNYHFCISNILELFVYDQHMFIFVSTFNKFVQCTIVCVFHIFCHFWGFRVLILCIEGVFGFSTIWMLQNMMNYTRFKLWYVSQSSIVITCAIHVTWPLCFLLCQGYKDLKCNVLPQWSSYLKHSCAFVTF